MTFFHSSLLLNSLFVLLLSLSVFLSLCCSFVLYRSCISGISTIHLWDRTGFQFSFFLFLLCLSFLSQLLSFTRFYSLSFSVFLPISPFLNFSLYPSISFSQQYHFSTRPTLNKSSSLFSRYQGKKRWGKERKKERERERMKRWTTPSQLTSSSQCSWVGCYGLMDRALWALETEFGGSNPSHVEVFFSWAFFFFFLISSSSSSFPTMLIVISLCHNACWPVNSGFTTGEARRE